MVREVKEMQEIMKIPLGKALLEKEMARSFRHLGLNIAEEWTTGAISSSSGSDSEADPEGMDVDDDNIDDLDIDKMSVDEPEQPEPSVPSLGEELGPGGRAGSAAASSEPNISPGGGLGISQSHAKRWLGSI